MGNYDGPGPFPGAADDPAVSSAIDWASLPRMPVQNTTGNPITSGLASGYHSALGAFGSLGEAAGKLTGIPSLQQAGADYAQTQQQAAAAAGRPDIESQGWLDNNGIPNFKKAAYVTAKAVPGMLGAVAGGALASAAVPEAAALGVGGRALAGLGGILPRFGLGAATEAGSVAAAKAGAGIAGMTAAGFAGGVEGPWDAIKARAKAEGREPTQAEAAEALAVGVPMSAVAAFMPGRLKAMHEAGIQGSLGKAILTGAGTQAVLQGPLAASQVAVTQMFGPPKSPVERANEIVDAALTGSVVGGVTGGAIGALSRHAPATEVVKDPKSQADFVDKEAGISPADLGSTNSWNELTGEGAGETPPAPPAPTTNGWNELTGEGAAPTTATTNIPPAPVGEPAADVTSTRRGIVPPPARRAPLDVTSVQEQPIAEGELPQRPVGPIDPNDENSQQRMLFDREHVATPPDQLSLLAKDKEATAEERNAAQKELDIRAVQGEPDLFPEDEAKKKLDQSYEDTRKQIADAMGKGAPKGALKALKATDMVDAYSKLANDKDLQAKPGMDKVARQLGIIDAKGELLDIKAQRAKLMDEKDSLLENATSQSDIDAANAKAKDIDAQLQKFKDLQELRNESARRAATAKNAEAETAAKTERAKSLGIEPERLDNFDKVPESQQNAWRSLEELTSNPDIPQRMDVNGKPVRLRSWAAELQQKMEDGSADPKRIHQWVANIRKRVSDAIREQEPRESALGEEPQGGEGVRGGNEPGSEGTPAGAEVSRAGDATAAPLNKQEQAKIALQQKRAAKAAAAPTEAAAAAPQTKQEQVLAKRAKIAEQLKAGLTGNFEVPKTQAEVTAKRQALAEQFKSGVGPVEAKPPAELSATEERAFFDDIQKKWEAKKRGKSDVALTPEEQAELDRRKADTDEKVKDFLKRAPALDSVSRTATPIDGLIQQIADMPQANAHQALQVIAKSHPDPSLRSIAQSLMSADLRKVSIDREVVPGENGSYAPAMNFKDGGFIGLRNIEGGAQLMLHEAAHAASFQAIDNNTASAKRMDRLRQETSQQFKKLGVNPDHIYGMTDAHEFMAEVYSNPELREVMRMMPAGDGRSLLQKVYDGIMHILGIKPRDQEVFKNMLDAAEQTGRDIMKDDAEIRGKQYMESVQRGVQAFTGPPVFGRRDPNLRVSAKDMDNALRTSTTLGGKINDVLQHFSSPEMMASGVRKLAYYFRTLTPLCDWVKGSLKAAPEYASLHNLSDAAKNKMTDLHAREVVQPIRDWEKTAKPADVAEVNRIAREATIQRLDPTKQWGEHKWLHDAQNSAALQISLQNMRRDFGRLPTEAKDAFQKLRDGSAMQLAADNAVMTYEALKDAMPGVDLGEHPIDTFMANGDINQKLGTSRAFWEAKQDTYKKLMEPQLAKSVADIASTRPGNPPARGASATEKEAFNQQTKAYEKLKAEHQILQGIYKDVETTQRQSSEGAYFPLNRTGQYYASAHFPMIGADAAGKGGTVDKAQVDKLQKLFDDADFKGVSFFGNPEQSAVFMRFETIDQSARAAALMRKAQQEGILDPAHAVSEGSPENPSNLRGMMPAHLQKAFHNIMESSVWNDNPEAAETVRKNMQGLIMELYQPDSLNRMDAHRKGVAGYNADMVDNYAHRTQTHANAFGKLAYQSRINEAFGSMKADAQDMKSDPKWTTSQRQSAHEALTELAMRQQDRQWNAAPTWIGKLRGINHFMYVGLSPGYVMELVGQIGMLTWPELAKANGYVKSAKEMANVTPVALKVLRSMWSNGLDMRLSKEAMIKEGVPEATAEWLEKASNRGGFAQSTYTTAQTEALGGGNKVIKFTKALDVASESLGRIVALLAAKNLHEKAGRDPTKADAYADEVNKQSQMRWGSDENARSAGRHGAFGQMSPLMLSFTGYQTRLIEKLYAEANYAFGRNVEPGKAGEQQKAEARKFLAGHLAAVTALSGTMGLPMAGLIVNGASKLANTLTQTGDYDFEGSYRNWLNDTFGKDTGEMVAKGATRGLGIDTSRMGEQDIAPFTKLLTNQRKMEDALPDWANSMGGSPLSLVESRLKTVREIMNGNYMKAAELFATGWPKDLVKAYHMSEYGYETADGRPLPGITPSGADILKTALGFEPQNLAEYKAQEGALNTLKDTRDYYKKNIEQNLLRAQNHGDTAGLNDWMGRASEWGQNDPYHQVLPEFGAALAHQQQQEAVAAATRTPFGTNYKDPNEVKKVSFGNIK
jgi:hypothetical protein